MAAANDVTGKYRITVTNYAEIGTEGSSEFRQFRFQIFGLLELHLYCLKSEQATSTIIQH